jgi:anthranilate synthase/aminodeoxychorismate synthase-like glutamine amidotransferase
MAGSLQQGEGYDRGASACGGSGMILLLDNYDSFTYNLYQYLCELGAKVRVLRNDVVTADGVARMKPSHIVISPGPGRPEEAGVSMEVIRKLGHKVPLLGVCLGHQAMAQVFGGKIVRAPRLMHGKTSSIFHDGKGIYRGVENPFTATRYHSLVADRRSLPSVFTVSARTSDGVVMGIRHNEFPMEGVQFHPESIMTPEGKNLLRNFLKVCHG